MRMKTLTGNAIALIAPLLILAPLVYFAKGTAPSTLNTVANISSLAYVIWVIYVIGWAKFIGLLMLIGAGSVVWNGNYKEAAEFVFGGILGLFILFATVLQHVGLTPEQQAKNKLADEEAMEEAHRMETDRSDQDFFDRHH